MKHTELKSILEKLHIVYIEDDDAISQYILEFLKRYTPTIFAASNGEDGYELYLKHSPDIMIVDINLPKMSGMELITKIRNNDQQTRIIISTAYTNKEFTLEAIELNLTRYLVKPITKDDLLGALEKSIKQLDTFSLDYYTIDLGYKYSFNTKKNQLFYENNPIELRKKEFVLLKFFIKNQNTTITYTMLENEIWQDNFMTLDAIRSQIKNIRKKTHPLLFKNISGIGYRLYSKTDE